MPKAVYLNRRSSKLVTLRVASVESRCWHFGITLAILGDWRLEIGDGACTVICCYKLFVSLVALLLAWVTAVGPAVWRKWRLSDGVARMMEVALQLPVVESAALAGDGDCGATWSPACIVLCPKRPVRIKQCSVVQRDLAPAIRYFFLS